MFVIGLFIKLYAQTQEETSNIEVVRDWVLLKSNILGDLKLSDSPPIPNLGDPIILEDSDFKSKIEETPKGYKKIADALIDCWNAFDKGETPFMGAWKSTISGPFCFHCRTIFIEGEEGTYQGLANFIETEKPKFSDKTYLEYLRNVHPINPVGLGSTKLEGQLDKEIYVFFYARNGDILDVVPEGIAIGAGIIISFMIGRVGAASVPKSPASKMMKGYESTRYTGPGSVPPLTGAAIGAKAISAIKGGVTGTLLGVAGGEAAYQALQKIGVAEKPKYIPLIIFGPPELINKACESVILAPE